MELASRATAQHAIVDTSRPLRLALVGNHPSSMVDFRGALIAGLVSRGIEVFALAPGLTAKHEAALRDLGAVPISYRLERTGLNPLEDLASAAELLAALKRIKPDKTLSFTAKPVILGTPAARLAGVPERYAMIEGLGRSFVDVPGERHPILRLLLLVLYRLSLAHATRTLFLNHEDMAELVGRGLVAATSAEMIGGIGVDLAAWLPAPPVSGPATFLFASRLLREKGVLEFIAAARRVREQCADARFVVLGGTEPGGGVSQEEMNRAVDEGLISWPGHVQVQPHLREASVFVLPSYYREGVPRSIQEAMALGRAVITTDMPGCRDTVIHGETGLLVPPRDTEALAEAMLTFIREPDQIARMGRAGRSLAERRFDADAATARTMRAIGL